MFFRALVALALAGFLALTGLVLLRYGYAGFFSIATANAAVGQLFLDLAICLVLIAFWIHRDARRLGISPWPFLVAGGLFGVAGPLAYLLRRARRSARSGLEDARLPVPLPLAGLLLLGFMGFTFFALARHGYAAIVFFAGANEATHLLFVDLVLSLTFLVVLTVRDARGRGSSYAPFLPLAFFFGSAGPLLYLVTRGLPLRAQRTAGLAGLVAFGFAMTIGSGDVDLRNGRVQTDDRESERRGGEKLLRLAERHGLAAWRRHRTMETVASDVWPRGGPWWPEDTQRFRAQSILGTFTSRVELLDGRGAGEIWGLQAWSPYVQKSTDAEPRFLAEPDEALTFYLPTLQYFMELPFRLLSATVVRDAGSVRHRGLEYELVFVTWGRPEPQPDLDQYVLWIDVRSGLLAKVRYTVRDALARMSPEERRLLRSLAAGTMHYEDYREIEGVQVPFLQTVTLPPPELTRYPLSASFFHQVTVERASFDTVAAEALVPDPVRGQPADRKPALDSN